MIEAGSRRNQMADNINPIPEKEINSYWCEGTEFCIDCGHEVCEHDANGCNADSNYFYGQVCNCSNCFPNK
jgi:hypothetical protein